MGRSISSPRIDYRVRWGVLGRMIDAPESSGQGLLWVTERSFARLERRFRSA